MTIALQEYVDKFIKNKSVLETFFKEENKQVYPICAMLFQNATSIITQEKLKECSKLIDDCVGRFSNFRSDCKMVLVSMLARNTEPQIAIEKALTIYNELKNSFTSSSFLPVAALLLAERTEGEDYIEISQKSLEIYKKMRGFYPNITSIEDVVYIILLAASDRNVDEICTEIKMGFDDFCMKKLSENTKQDLSFSLTLLNGNIQNKCEKLSSFYKVIKSKGCKFGDEHEVSTLGILANISENQENLVDKMLEIDEILKCQKGYGFFGYTNRERMLQVGELVINQEINQIEKKAFENEFISDNKSDDKIEKNIKEVYEAVVIVTAMVIIAKK